MLIDLARTPSADLDADIVVVGAGAVGLALAVRLSRQGVKVLLLEAGGASLEVASQQVFREISVSGRPWAGADKGRYRSLGGTTLFWGGQVVEFEDTVFSERPWVANSAWPIRPKDLRGPYQIARELIGAQVPAADDLRRGKNGAESPRFSPALDLYLSEWLPETNFGRLFARDIATSPTLKVVVHAPAIAIEANTDGHIQAIIVRGPKGSQLRATGRKFVVASGTLEAVRLLAASTVCGRPAPWSQSSWLGRGFMDHLDINAGSFKVLDQHRFHDVFDNFYIKGRKFTPKLKLSGNTQKDEHLLGIAGHLIFDSIYREHLDNLKYFAKSLLRGRLPTNILHLPRHLAALARVATPLATRYLISRRAYNLADAGIRLRLTAEQRPLYESVITLGPDKDSQGLARIDVHWKVASDDIETMARFSELVADELAQSGLATLAIDPRLQARDPGFLNDAEDAYHHMGGARMAVNAADGVVDADLRVHGSTNLFVAGAATFPSAGFANPTLTAIALAMRLADHLQEAGSS